jgi:hypothetical protein
VSAPAVEAEIVTEPGVYKMPADVYHADPVPGGSLSASSARKLLPPSVPAKFDYERRHPPEPTEAFNFGRAAHSIVLGDGPELVVVDRERWDTKAVKAEVADIRAAGNVPLKPDEYRQVHDMADALRRHRTAAALFEPGTGTPEQSLFWRDAEFGVMRRCRLDWMRRHRNGRLIVPDYKTAESAAPEDFSGPLYKYGYAQQADWYCDGIKALGIDDDPVFIFVVQEKTPPYLISTFQPDWAALRIAHHRNREAIYTYQHCTRTGIWPGYSDDVEMVSMPGWVQSRYQEVLR